MLQNYKSLLDILSTRVSIACSFSCSPEVWTLQVQLHDEIVFEVHAAARDGVGDTEARSVGCRPPKGIAELLQLARDTVVQVGRKVPQTALRIGGGARVVDSDADAPNVGAPALLSGTSLDTASQHC